MYYSVVERGSERKCITISLYIEL